MSLVTKAARAASFAAVILASSTIAHRAAAEDAKAQCVAAHEAAQLHRRQSEFLPARDKLRICAQNLCPAVIQSDCVEWLGEVERSIPSIVIEARGDEGDIFDVKVTMDGRPLTSRLEGKAIEVDPGAHSFRFESPGKPPSEQRLLVKEGEKNKVVSVSWESPKAAQSSDAGGSRERPAGPRPVPALTYVLGGVGLAGLGAFVAFAAIGSSQKSDLTKTCSPFCKDDQVSKAKTPFLIADISLVVGVVGLASAAVVYFTRPEKGPEEPTKAARAPKPSTQLGIAPIPGGGAAMFGGTF